MSIFYHKDFFLSTDGCRNFKTPSKIEENFLKNLLFSSVFGLWFCQKSCTDKALCFFSYLTEILTKRVFFRHFCKSVKSPVFTGLFGLFISYKCLILLTFWKNIFRYLRISFLICRNASTARNQFVLTDA